MDGATTVLNILSGIGQLVVLLVLAFVLFRLSKFIDSLSDAVKK
ncbi:MAG: hypothetical protein PHO70_06715 [Candidatus Omnitrophica bacterium]|nr:hypothetical protein [Candidatus Omnitrophota bacterium]